MPDCVYMIQQPSVEDLSWQLGHLIQADKFSSASWTTRQLPWLVGHRKTWLLKSNLLLVDLNGRFYAFKVPTLFWYVLNSLDLESCDYYLIQGGSLRYGKWYPPEMKEKKRFGYDAGRSGLAALLPQRMPSQHHGITQQLTIFVWEQGSPSPS